jgi:DNA-binding response OmpR family regulator
MVSASVFENEAKLFCQAGCDDLVNKPFQIDKIYQCIEKLLPITFEKTILEEMDQAVIYTQSEITLDPDVLHKLQEAAEFSLITDLDEILDQLAETGENEKRFAEHLKELAAVYNMEEILSILDNLNV